MVRGGRGTATRGGSTAAMTSARGRGRGVSTPSLVAAAAGALLDDEEEDSGPPSGALMGTVAGATLTVPVMPVAAPVVMGAGQPMVQGGVVQAVGTAQPTLAAMGGILTSAEAMLTWDITPQAVADLDKVTRIRVSQFDGENPEVLDTFLRQCESCFLVAGNEVKKIQIVRVNTQGLARTWWNRLSPTGMLRMCNTRSSRPV